MKEAKNKDMRMACRKMARSHANQGSKAHATDKARKSARTTVTKKARRKTAWAKTEWTKAERVKTLPAPPTQRQKAHLFFEGPFCRWYWLFALIACLQTQPKHFQQKPAGNHACHWQQQDESSQGAAPGL